MKSEAERMQTLTVVAPELMAELADALASAGRAELADQLASVVVDCCTHEPGDGLGYIYFVRPTPSAHFAKLAAPVAETVVFDERGLNVDVDHDGNLFGLELIGRSDVLAKLSSSDLMS